MRAWACAAKAIARGKVSFARGALATASAPGQTPASAGASAPHKPTQKTSPNEKRQGNIALPSRIFFTPKKKSNPRASDCASLRL
jgi:hypothetical protein